MKRIFTISAVLFLVAASAAPLTGCATSKRTGPEMQADMEKSQYFRRILNDPAMRMPTPPVRGPR